MARDPVARQAARERYERCHVVARRDGKAAWQRKPPAAWKRARSLRRIEQLRVWRRRRIARILDRDG